MFHVSIFTFHGLSWTKTLYYCYYNIECFRGIFRKRITKFQGTLDGSRRYGVPSKIIVVVRNKMQISGNTLIR